MTSEPLPSGGWRCCDAMNLVEDEKQSAWEWTTYTCQSCGERVKYVAPAVIFEKRVFELQRLLAEKLPQFMVQLGPPRDGRQVLEFAPKPIRYFVSDEEIDKAISLKVMAQIIAEKIQDVDRDRCNRP